MPVHSEQDDISDEQWKATGSGKWGFSPPPLYDMHKSLQIGLTSIQAIS